MVSKTRLYDAFGELIYTVAIADGIIQEDEVKIIEERLKEFEWGEEVKWSFNYEKKKGSDLKETYLKALETFKDYGPHPDYYNLIELLEDVVTLLLPTSPAEILDAIKSLKVYKLLDGYRGQPKVDMHNLCEQICNLSRLVQLNHQKIKELEINPLFVYPKATCVVDAIAYTNAQG